MQLQKLIILFISVILTCNLWGQTTTTKTTADNPPSKLNALTSTPGKVNIVADSAIVNLEKGSRKFKETKGYRIQIFLGSVDQAKMERNKYLSLGLPYSVYSKQIVPEQALQIGDFISRMDMEKALVEIEKHYPKAFGVVSVIEPPKYSAQKK